MYHDHPLLDSYQNQVYGPDANESVEAVNAAADHEGVEGSGDGSHQDVAALYAADGLWDSDEQAERLADDLASGRAEDDSPGADESRGFCGSSHGD
jgi:hypothetical protein